MWQGHEAEQREIRDPEYVSLHKCQWGEGICGEMPGRHTTLAAFDVADPCEGSAGIHDCCETDEDAAADMDSIILFACTGAAAIRACESVRSVDSREAD